jgi:Flp pilus assembly protein TadD
VLIDATIAAMFQKNFPAAKDPARKAAQLDPSHFFPVMVEGWADIEAGKFNEAVAL